MNEINPVPPMADKETLPVVPTHVGCVFITVNKIDCGAALTIAVAFATQPFPSTAE